MCDMLRFRPCHDVRDTLVRTPRHEQANISFARKQGDNKVMTSTTLSESLGLHADPDYFVILHDHIRGLDYIRSSEQICREGLFLKLHAYEYYAFNDIYEVRDDDQHTWRQLFEWLNGDGTPDIQEALEEAA